jgi:glucose/arabinose dehydrogenase
LITSLKYNQVHSLLLKDGRLTDEKLIYQGEDRLRDIALDSNSDILLLTDGAKASIIKLSF